MSESHYGTELTDFGTLFPFVPWLIAQPLPLSHIMLHDAQRVHSISSHIAAAVGIIAFSFVFVSNTSNTSQPDPG